jgi:NurA-like 5'-3' nuclease
MEENKNFSRKKFLTMAGIGIAGIAILKKSPLRLLAGKKEKKKLEVKIHSLAVKRENRGSIHG